MFDMEKVIEARGSIKEPAGGAGSMDDEEGIDSGME